MTKSTVTALSTGERLPCEPSSRGCAGASHAYSWTVPATMDCPLQVIRQAEMVREAGSAILVDNPAQIVLEVTGTTPTPVGTCPGGWLTTTEPRIVVMLNVSKSLGLETVPPEEVDPFLALSMNRMYLEYWLDLQNTAAGELTEQQECRRRLAALQQQHTVEVAAGRFMRHTGDALEVFQCRQVITTIRTAAECHRDIPVHGPQPFADVHNRIL